MPALDYWRRAPVEAIALQRLRAAGVINAGQVIASGFFAGADMSVSPDRKSAHADLLFVDSQGYAHPRRLGIASTWAHARAVSRS